MLGEAALPPLLVPFGHQRHLRRHAFQWLVPKGTSWYTATFGATLYRPPCTMQVLQGRVASLLARPITPYHSLPPTITPYHALSLLPSVSILSTP